MMIPKDASICPHCRKRQGMSSGFKLLLGLILFFAFMAIIRPLLNGGKNADKNTSSTLVSSALQSTQGAVPKGQSDSNATDDEVYTDVKRCMDLQYSLRPGWVPSDTNNAAFCIGKVVHNYGEKRVKKMIGLWFDQPRSFRYMTLFTEKEVTMINQALAGGAADRKLRQLLIDMVLANATIKAYEAQNGQRN